MINQSVLEEMQLKLHEVSLSKLEGWSSLSLSHSVNVGALLFASKSRSCCGSASGRDEGVRFSVCSCIVPDFVTVVSFLIGSSSLYVRSSASMGIADFSDPRFLVCSSDDKVGMDMHYGVGCIRGSSRVCGAPNHSSSNPIWSTACYSNLA